MPQIAAAITAAATTFGATAVGSFLTTGFMGKLLTSVALSALSAALAPRPRPPGIKTSQTMTGGTNPCQFILGKYATGGYAVSPAMSHGKAGKTHNAYLTYVLEVSDAPVSALSSLIIDGTPVTIGTTADPDYGLPIQGEFVDRAWVKFYTGAQVAADPMLIAKYGSYPDRPWQSDMIGRGLAYAVLTFRYDRKVFDSLPSVRFVVDGLKLYDPRKDSSVGGSGAQRWATPSTWAFSRNPVVMIYNIMRGITLPDGSRWGGTCTAADLPLANWIAAMNVCDVEVTMSGGGTIARYTAGFEVSVDDEPAAVIEELLKACNGQMVDMGGIWKIRAGSLGLPVFFFTDEDIIATRPEEFDPFPGLAETYNGITATYPEPTSLWESREAPARYNATWEAEDGGRRLVASLSLPAVTHSRQVQHLMQAAIKDHRRMRRHNLTLTPAAAIIEPLDVVSWTSARNGYSAKSFEVAQVAEDLRSCLPQIAIREVDPTDYDWSPSDELPSTPGPGGVIRPAVQAVPGFGVSGVSLTDAGGAARRPALQLVWDGAELDDAEALEWEIRRSGTTDLVAQGSTANVEAGLLRVAGGILPSTIYEARARLVVKRARAWTSWIGATTPNVLTGTADLAQSVYDQMEATARLAGVTPVSSLPASGQLNQIVMLIPPGRLYRWNGSAWVTTIYTGIEPGSLDTAAFAANIRPVEIVSSLPTTGNSAGRTVYLTTDGKLYRHTGSPAGAGGFTVAVDGADLVANSITAGKIAAGAIGADQIAAGALVASKVLVSAFDNLFPDYDMEDPAFYGTTTGASYSFQVSALSQVGRLVLSLPVAPDQEIAVSGWFPVERVSDYRAAGTGWVVSGTGSGALRIEFGTADGSGSVTSTRSVLVKTVTDGTTTVAAVNIKTDADENRARFRMVRDGGGTGPLAFGGLKLTRRSDGELVVDGAITANKISAGAVTADAIAAGAIVASKIAAGEITGDKLAATNLITAEAQIGNLVVDTIKLKDGAVSVFNATGQAAPITNNSAAWTTTDTMTVNMGTSSYAQAVIGLYTFALTADPASYPAGFRLQVYFAADLVAEIDKSTLTANPGVRRYTLSLARPAVSGAAFAVVARIQNAGGYGIQSTNLWAIAEKK